MFRLKLQYTAIWAMLWTLMVQTSVLLPLFAYAKGFEYLVQPGDTLSRILLKKVQALSAEQKKEVRIYGNQGLLIRTVKLNPGLRNADLIYPGHFLQLPEILVHRQLASLEGPHVISVPASTPLSPAPSLAPVEPSPEPGKNMRVSLGLGAVLSSNNSAFEASLYSISLGQSGHLTFPLARLTFETLLFRDFQVYAGINGFSVKYPTAADSSQSTTEAQAFIGLRHPISKSLNLGAAYHYRAFSYHSPDSQSAGSFNLLEGAAHSISLQLDYRYQPIHRLEVEAIIEVPVTFAASGSGTDNLTLDSAGISGLGLQINSHYFATPNVLAGPFAFFEYRSFSFTESGITSGTLDTNKLSIGVGLQFGFIF